MKSVKDIQVIVMANPLVAFCVAFGFAKVPKPKVTSAILKSMGKPNGDGDIKTERGTAATLLNKINQAKFLKGDLCSARGFASGKTMLVVDKSPLGSVFATAMAALAVNGASQVLAGEIPAIKKPNGKGEMVYDYRLTCAVLGELGVGGFDRDRESVIAALESQIKANKKSKAA